MIVKGKKWWQSKTIWAAVLELGTGLALAFDEGATTAAIALVGFSGLQVVLRALTKEGIMK